MWDCAKKEPRTLLKIQFLSFELKMSRQKSDNLISRAEPTNSFEF